MPTFRIHCLSPSFWLTLKKKSGTYAPKYTDLRLRKRNAYSSIEYRSTHYSWTRTSQKQCVRVWIGFNWFGLISRTVAFENGKTPSSFLICRTIIRFSRPMRGLPAWMGACRLVVHVVDSFFRVEPDNRDVVFL